MANQIQLVLFQVFEEMGQNCCWHEKHQIMVSTNGLHTKTNNEQKKPEIRFLFPKPYNFIYIVDFDFTSYLLLCLGVVID